MKPHGMIIMRRSSVRQCIGAPDTTVMLHPFLVKITPKYANKNAIVVKVKTFDDQTDSGFR